MNQDLIVVSEKNEVIKTADTTDIHKNNLLHRSVHVIIVDSKGRFFCRKINSASPLYANYWSTATGAHVLANHNTLETAYSSIKDMLGIHTDLKFIGDIHISDNVENEISSTYIGNFDGPFNLNGDKVADGKFFTEEELNNLFKSEKVTPHLIESIKLYKRTT